MKHLLLIALAACGGGSAMTSGGDDVAPGIDAGGTNTLDHAGTVMAQTYMASNATGGSASAYFASAAGGCATATVGACEIATCTNLAGTQAEAGTVAITGGTQNVALTPETDKTYTTLTTTTALFTGGETLKATALGGDVPAFTATVTAPTLAKITSPAKPASFMLAVDRAHDLAVTWTGGGGGKLQVFVSGGNKQVTCRFDASAGAGTVPAAVLGMLPTGSGSFAMASIASAEVAAGDYAVTFLAYFNAVWQSDSGIVSGGAMLQ